MAEAKKALWAKCPDCGHCWPAAYYPMNLADMGRVLKSATCPHGCKGKPLLARQEDGELLEPATAPGANP